MLTFTQFVWFGSSLIEGVILVRSIQCKSFAKYSLFYAYIVSLLCMSLFLRAAYIAMPSLIFRLYWPLESIASALGCGVTLEIIRHVFAGHISLKRFARRAALMVFGMIFLELAILAVLLLRWNPTVYQAHLGTDLRQAQAVGLIAIIYPNKTLRHRSWEKHAGNDFGVWSLPRRELDFFAAASIPRRSV
jgi:hypothetical protein